MVASSYNRFQYGISLGLSTLNELTMREKRACGISNNDFKSLMFQRYNTQFDPRMVGTDIRATFRFEETKKGNDYSYQTAYLHSPDLERKPVEESAKFAMHEASHSLRWQKMHNMKAVKMQKNLVGAAFGLGLLHSVMSNDVAFDVSSFAVKAAGYAVAGIGTFKALRQGLRLYDEAMAYKLQGAVDYLLQPYKPTLAQIQDEKKKMKKDLSPWQKIKDFVRGYPSEKMHGIFTLNGYEMAAKNINFDADRVRAVHYAASENLRNGKFLIR